MTTQPAATPKKKPSKNYYFTKETEDAIIAYVSETDQFVRNAIYKDKIDYAFNKLVENLIHRQKFYNYEVSYEDTKHETITHLIEKLDKFNPAAGKAYSYFTVICLNHLTSKNKQQYNNTKLREEVSVIDASRNLINETDNKERVDALCEFMDGYISYCDLHLNDMFSKLRDKQIATAVLELFRRRKNIEEFNKKALYIMIREQTDSETHDITKVVGILKLKYVELYKEYLRSKII